MPTKTRNRVTQLREIKSAVATATAQQTIAASANKNGSSLSHPEVLRRLYSSLLRSRLVQERMQELSRSNSAAPQYDFNIGGEAVAVGATADLGPEDSITASPRNLAALIARGASMRAFLTGVADASASSFPPALPEDPFHLATGLALAHKFQQKGHVAVAFCAKQNPRLESWHDALKFAAVHRLPVVFVIENGVAAEASAPDEAPYLEPLSFLARDYDFPGILVDGNDTVAVWRVAQESIHRARIGSGPTLIDCRSDSQRDPLAHMEHYLRQRNFWDDSWRQQVEREIKHEIEDTVTHAR